MNEKKTGTGPGVSGGVSKQKWGLLFMALALLVLGILKGKSRTAEAAQLAKKYGSEDTDFWSGMLQEYTNALEDYETQKQEYRNVSGFLEVRLSRLQTQKASLCGEQLPEKVIELWQQVLRQWEQRDEAQREVLRTRNTL